MMVTSLQTSFEKTIGACLRGKDCVMWKIAGFDEKQLFGPQWTGVVIAATFGVQTIFEKEFQNRCGLFHADLEIEMKKHY